jgi:hypothetical protein
LSELDYWYSKKTDNIDKIYGVEKIFRRTKVDEKTLMLVQKHNEIAQEYLKKIRCSGRKEETFYRIGKLSFEERIVNFC